MPKKIKRGVPLVLPGMVCYAEQQGKPFWSSSLGQMLQFDTIIFGRTFKNYFGQFVWIEKKSHYNSRVSLHEAPTKNTKLSQYFTVIFPFREEARKVVWESRFGPPKPQKLKILKPLILRTF